ncbi:MAG: DUF721 domain-containing protein [Candidatus Binatia bacterium]
MKPPSRQPSPVGDVLSRVLKRVDPDQELRAYGIWTFWDDEVGTAIARRAQPVRFRDGILFVAVATHSWMQELRFMKDAIRDRLNGRLGAALVQDIFFVSGQVESPPVPAAAAPHEETPAGPNLIPLPPIADPELAAAFNRIVQARAKRLAIAPRRHSGRPRAKKPR